MMSSMQNTNEFVPLQQKRKSATMLELDRSKYLNDVISLSKVHKACEISNKKRLGNFIVK